MEINKQLFEDILSGKLKGTFVLKDGQKITSDGLQRNLGCLSETHPYLLVDDLYHKWEYNLDGRHLISDEKFHLDIIDFIPDTDMKENELTIEIPQGKEIDWDESKKQNKIVLKDKSNLSYGDVCRKLFGNQQHYHIMHDGHVEVADFYRCDTEPNAAKTRHQLECILAKNRLANVAKYLNDGWKPIKGDHVFAITYRGDFDSEPIIGEYYFGTGENLVLFRTQKSAQQAIEILGEETVKLALEPLGV